MAEQPETSGTSNSDKINTFKTKVSEAMDLLSSLSSVELGAISGHDDMTNIVSLLTQLKNSGSKTQQNASAISDRTPSIQTSLYPNVDDETVVVVDETSSEIVSDNVVIDSSQTSDAMGLEYIGDDETDIVGNTVEIDSSSRTEHVVVEDSLNHSELSEVGNHFVSDKVRLLGGNQVEVVKNYDSGVENLELLANSISLGSTREHSTLANNVIMDNQMSEIENIEKTHSLNDRSLKEYVVSYDYESTAAEGAQEIVLQGDGVENLVGNVNVVSEKDNIVAVIAVDEMGNEYVFEETNQDVQTYVQMAVDSGNYVISDGMGALEQAVDGEYGEYTFVQHDVVEGFDAEKKEDTQDIEGDDNENPFDESDDPNEDSDEFTGIDEADLLEHSYITKEDDVDVATLPKYKTRKPRAKGLKRKRKAKDPNDKIPVVNLVEVEREFADFGGYRTSTKSRIQVENITEEPIVIKRDDASAHLHIATKRRPYRRVTIGDLTCQYCGAVMQSRPALESHLRTHTGSRPFECDQCDRKFTTKGNMFRHMRSHTGARPFNCELCGKTFTEKRSVMVHMRSHTGERPYKCHICPRTFIQQNTLQSHLHMHMGHKGHLCDHCGKSFRQRSHLKVHLRRVFQMYKFKCDECDAGFCAKLELTKHKIKHIKNPAYSCEVCPEKFFKKSNLTRHLNRKHSRYTCGVCLSGFYDLDSFKIHAKRLHTEEEMTVDPDTIVDDESVTFLLTEDKEQEKTVPKPVGKRGKVKAEK